MTTTTVRLHLHGNAASHRHCWDADTFVRAFKRSKPFPGLVWGATVDIVKKEIYFCAEDPTNVATGFVQFVEYMVRQGVGDYQHAQICVTCALVDSIYSLTVRALYGDRQTYQIIVHAPESVLDYVADFTYLFECMETLLEWDVNSIVRFASIPHGVHFDALESDACTMFNYLSDELRDQIPTILEDVADEPLQDVLLQKSRRGNRMYIRIGIEWATYTEWGAPGPRLPVLSDPSVVVQALDHDCAICMDSLQSDLIQWGECNHVFHLQCVRNLWTSAVSPKCPLCRGLMTTLQKVHVQAETEPKKPRSIASRVKARKRKLFEDE